MPLDLDVMHHQPHLLHSKPTCRNSPEPTSSPPHYTPSPSYTRVISHSPWFNLTPFGAQSASSWCVSHNAKKYSNELHKVGLVADELAFCSKVIKIPIHSTPSDLLVFWGHDGLSINTFFSMYIILSCCLEKIK